MEINRRQFIQASTTIVLLGSNVMFAKSNSQNLLSCRTNQEGEHFFSVIDSDGRLALNTALPARGHGITLDPSQRFAAVFARRPGNFVWIIDLLDKQVVEKIYADNARHFYGHGLFSKDGTRLLCSENAFETGEGVIGIYDVNNNFTRLGEIKSHGIDPHEFKLLSDGETLVIANGGIRTHPDLPRIKSNLDTMRPNLAYVSVDSGHLLHKHEPETEWHQLSIRHIDISADDQVAIAMQFEGKPFLQPSLVAIQKDDQEMQFLNAPTQVQSQLRNYCGSVCFSSDGTHFVVTAPRGGVATYWSANGEYLGNHVQADACGISRVQGQLNDFYISDGAGSIVRAKLNTAAEALYSFKRSKWDNHMLAVHD